jgi:hypothetical protein
MTINAKMRQATDLESNTETEMIKQGFSHATAEKDEQPRESRWLEKEQSVLLLYDQCEDRSIIKAEEINSLSPLVRNTAELKSSTLAKELSVSSVTIETHNNVRNNEEEIVVYSCDDTSSVHYDCPPIQEESLKSLTEAHNDDSALASSAAIEMSDDLPRIPSSVSMKLSGCVQQSNSLRLSCAGDIDSVTCDEPPTNESHIHPLPNAVSDINENNKTAPKSIVVYRENENKPSSSRTENFGAEVHQNAIEQSMPEKEVSVSEVSKTGPNVTFTEASQSSSIRVKVVYKDLSNETVPQQGVTSKSRRALQNSPMQNVVELQKSTHLFRFAVCCC